MRYLSQVIFLLFILTTSFTSKAENFSYASNGYRTDTTVLDTLLSINYRYYEGKPIDSILSTLPQSFNKRYITSGSRPTIAESLMVIYQDRYVVQLYVRDYRYMNQKDYNRQWDFNLFKLETLTHAVLIKDNKCIKNCGNIDYLE